MSSAESVLKKTNRSMVRIIIFLLLLGGVAAFFYTEKYSFYAKMDEWKLIPQPERFTELYFENHSELPKIVSSEQEVNFSFSIHNLEGKEMVYRYEIYTISGDGERKILKQDSISLEDVATEVFQNTYTFPVPKDGMKVVIELPDLRQSIHFILTVE